MKNYINDSIKPLIQENLCGFEDRRHFLKTFATTAAGAFIAPSLITSYRDLSPVPQKRYPDPAIVTIDKRFEKYCQFNAAIERLWTGARWAEGPVWFGDGKFLLFSDIPNNTILRWTEETGKVSKFRSPSNYSNGNTRDRQGRLITCEHDTRRITRTEPDGSITVLIDKYQNKRLNAPNDVVVHSNGSIWFTDPGYGILSNYEGHLDQFELPTNVYRFDPSTGETTVVTDEFIRPNGLCFSPDEKLLYIVDTGQPDDKPQPIKVFNVLEGRKLSDSRLFCDMGKGGSDGIRCDIDGNVWAAAGGGGEGYDGVHIFAPDGKLIGKICLPEICSNLCFGGTKHNRLFMTASQSLYSLYVNTLGAQIP
ncbi:MAG: SMP-30/gluconolactonase/LRE family protein [Bacteroidia bacterium]|nr:SMP-30/gluconolactonase/LRE family protein [Bacteroidia bacterium]